jgi:hypothetical protein
MSASSLVTAYQSPVSTAPYKHMIPAVFSQSPSHGSSPFTATLFDTFLIYWRHKTFHTQGRSCVSSNIFAWFASLNLDALWLSFTRGSAYNCPLQYCSLSCDSRSGSFVVIGLVADLGP